MIKRTIKKFTCIMMTLAIVISCAFVYAPVEAATVPAPGQVLSIRATCISTYEATISWGKASGRVNGYTIYRNGKAIRYIENKSMYYKDTGLKASTKYTYQVRAYTFTGKKIRQWYNKKTKRWENSMPSWRVRGGTRLVNEKKYGLASPALVVKTQKAVVIHGEEMHPSKFKKVKKGNKYVWEYSFTKKSTVCKTCKKGMIVTVNYNPKQGSYSYSTTGSDNSKNCHNSKCKRKTP